MVLREVAQFDHHCGIKIHFYLDDWLIHHQDQVVLSQHLKFVISLASHLSWLSNLKKSDLVPSQQFVYLGLDFDTEAALVHPSLKHVERLEACICQGHISLHMLCCGCWAI